MNLIKNILWCLLFLLLCIADNGQALDWQEVKGTHFVSCYNRAADRVMAENALRRAEEYYRNIASTIGYARYANFWTWGDRVKIFLFSSQQAFLDETKQPQWSRGGAFYSESLGQRAIATYLNQPLLFSEVLPHEIAHLILTDFIGSESVVPKWFSEGVAQLAEENKTQKADLIMRISVRFHTYFPIESLERYDIARERDAQKVGLFYAQSVSMVDFLIKRFGSEKFGLWCRQIATGKNFFEAFRLVYGLYIESWDNFEKKWIAYLNE